MCNERNCDCEADPRRHRRVSCILHERVEQDVGDANEHNGESANQKDHWEGWKDWLHDRRQNSDNGRSYHAGEEEELRITSRNFGDLLETRSCTCIDVEEEKNVEGEHESMWKVH